MQLTVSIYPASDYLSEEYVDLEAPPIGSELDEQLFGLCDGSSYIFAQSDDSKSPLPSDPLGVVTWTEREVFMLPVERTYKLPNFDETRLDQWLSQLTACCVTGVAVDFFDRWLVA